MSTLRRRIGTMFALGAGVLAMLALAVMISERLIAAPQRGIPTPLPPAIAFAPALLETMGDDRPRRPLARAARISPLYVSLILPAPPLLLPPSPAPQAVPLDLLQPLAERLRVFPPPPAPPAPQPPAAPAAAPPPAARPTTAPPLEPLEEDLWR